MNLVHWHLARLFWYMLSCLESKQVHAVAQCIGSAYTASPEKAIHTSGDIFKLLFVEQATCTSLINDQGMSWHNAPT